MPLFVATSLRVSCAVGWPVNGGNVPPVSPWYRFIRGLAFWVARILWGLRVEGREHIPPEGAAVVACNHRSLLDPAIVGGTLPREAGFLAKRELFEVPVLSALIRSLNAIPIDRSRLSHHDTASGSAASSIV